jgi:hypothetical protein
MKSHGYPAIFSSVLRPRWLGVLAAIGFLANASALAAEIHGQVLFAGARCTARRAVPTAEASRS